MNDIALRALRYLISGCTAAVVNIGAFYVLTDLMEVWYVVSSIIAFLVSFLVSFTLQRLWTFRLRTQEKIGLHVSLYLTVAVANTILNTMLVFVVVEYVHLWHILAQIIAGTCVAVWSFFIYQYVIFKPAQ